MNEIIWFLAFSDLENIMLSEIEFSLKLSVPYVLSKGSCSSNFSVLCGYWQG